jgi:sugar lactone lactonase YvrE
MKNRFALGWSLTVGAGLLAVACAPDAPTTPSNAAPEFSENGIALDLIPPGQSTPFQALATSAACSAGGLGGRQIVLPAGYVYSVVASEGAGFTDLADMNTVNETGERKGRYLYRTHETGSDAAVSETDLVTGATRIVSQRADWERFDGIVWTPWGTILAAEEAGVPAFPDPNVPQAQSGLVYEINPQTGASVARPANGARAPEGLRFDKQGNLYGISETTPGYIFKFVPDTKGDLSAGQLYALKLTNDVGDRTGTGVWVALDRNAVQVNSVAEATAKGATGYGRPEDLEIGTSTGSDHRGDDILFVAITSEDRVLAIDLKPRGQVELTVTDYVRDGVNAPTDFDAPDNLALDKSGNLYITEDPGGSAPSKTLGDDVWFAPWNPQSAARSLPAVRFLSITDCNAEPTGVYMSISNKTLFLNVQHRGGDGADLSVAIQRLADVSFSVGTQD